EASNAYAIVIQAGAILAVLGLYRARVRQMLLGAVGRDPFGAKLLLAIFVAFIPAAGLGLAADDAIEAWLFGPWTVAIAWALGGLLLLVLDKRLRLRRGGALESIELRMALIIGLSQCAALCPGVSR